MIISVIGLLFLKYYKRLRANLFYTALENDQIDKATHIYIRGTDKIESICTITKTSFEGRASKVFTFKHLKYEYRNGDFIPLGLRYVDSIHEYDHEFIKKGLDNQEV
jgi:hypothetical protein